MKRFSVVMMVLFGMGTGVSALDPNTVIANLDTGTFNTYAQAQLAVFEQDAAENWVESKKILDAVIAKPYNSTVAAKAEYESVLRQRYIYRQELKTLILERNRTAAYDKWKQIKEHQESTGVDGGAGKDNLELIPGKILNQWKRERLIENHTSGYAQLNQASVALDDRDYDLAIQKILAFYKYLNDNNLPFIIPEELRTKAKSISRPVSELINRAGSFRKRRTEDILDTENKLLGAGEIKLSSGRNILKAYAAFNSSPYGYKFMLAQPMQPHPLGRECIDWMQATFYEPYNIKQIDIYNNRYLTSEGVSRIQVGVYADGKWRDLGTFDIPEWSGKPVTIPVNTEKATRVFIEVLQTMSDVAAGISYIGVQIQ